VQHQLFSRYRALSGSIASVLTLAVALGAGCATSPDASASSGDSAIQQLAVLMERSGSHPSDAELAEFQGAHKGTRAGALARFLRGISAFEAKDYATAINALDGSEIAEHTSIGDYALLYRGRALAMSGRNADAVRVLSSIATSYPDSIVLKQAAVEAGRAALAAGDARLAVSALAEAAADGHGEALKLTGDAKSALGDTTGAVAAYRACWYTAPASVSAADSRLALQTLGFDPDTSVGSERELEGRADALFDAQQWKDAANAYGALLAAFPNRQDRERLALRRGTAAAMARDFPGAQTALLMVSTRDPKLHAEALYQIANAARRAGLGSELESTVSRLRTTYPKSDWTARAIGELIDYYDGRERTSEKIAMQRVLVANFPSSEKSAQASYELGWLAYRAGDFRSASEQFLFHLSTYRSPQTKWIGEAAFWGGRSWQALGNTSRAMAFYQLAAERYPYGYHGHIAKARLKELQSRFPSIKPEVGEPGSKLGFARENALAVQPITETADATVEPRLRRAADLTDANTWELATSELVEAQRVFPTSPRVALQFARMFRARGDNFQATVILRKGYPDVYSYRDDQMPREAWEIMFPLSNWETITKQAAANGIDPFVIAGLIRQESVFNPKALSRANARGMMQLLPSTGRLVAKSVGLGAVGPADLYNPSLNITLGTSYFAQQLARFGRVELAAAAYNAGPGRVVQWQAARSIDPIEEWVENIPFTETRGYVQGVLRYAANYRRFYGRGNERASNEW
jgi:soluble lytic murein transglycosylase